MNNILVAIINHNCEVTAENLYNLFSLDFSTVILDSGSTIKPKESIQFGNIFYGGLFNEAVKMSLEGHYEWLILITSDITIDSDNYIKFKKKLSVITNMEFVGLYSPSSVGGGHWFGNRLTKSELRPVPFVEGFFFLMRVSLLLKVYPIDLEINKIGWGIDTLQGFVSWKHGFGVFIDDSIQIQHPVTAGYNHNLANIQMLNLFKLYGRDFEAFNQNQGFYILKRYFTLKSILFCYLAFRRNFSKKLNSLCARHDLFWIKK